MKKTYVTLFLLAVLMVAAACLLPMGIPTPQALYYGASLPDGKTTVLENRGLISRIYTVQDEKIVDVYEEFRISQMLETLITHVGTDGENTCFIRLLRDEISYPWQLVALNDGKAEVLYEGDFADTGLFSGLSAKDGVYWLTFLGDDGSIQVYEYTEQTKLQAKQIHPAGTLEGIKSAEFDGTEVRAVCEDGSVWRIKADSTAEALPGEEEPQIPPVNANADFTSWLLCKRVVFQACGALWLLIAALLVLMALVTRYSKRLAVRLSVIGGVSLIFSMMAAGLFQLLVVAAFVNLQSAYIMFCLGLAAACVYILVFSVVLLFEVKRMTAAIPRLTAQMNEVSEGHINPQKVEPGRDELHCLSRAMQEMCLSLSIREYDLQSTIRSYQRFVPMEMTKLMKSGTVTELELGDTQRVQGFVGIFSIENHDDVRRSSDDSSFVKFINYNLRTLDHCVKKNEGYLLSGDFRLDSMNTVFRKGPDAARAALDFFGRAQLAKEEGIAPPDAACILHQTSFLYGIAGWEERLFPYLSSAELEFLRGFTHRFHDAGVHLAATRKAWRALEQAGFTGRYIGYLQSENGTDMAEGGRYDMYEILDTYPQMEREMRKSYDERFQKALRLFYQNDFYLARNLFSELMKLCPADGVARWYLFACEHYFHETENEAAHNLFGSIGV